MIDIKMKILYLSIFCFVFFACNSDYKNSKFDDIDSAEVKSDTSSNSVSINQLNQNQSLRDSILSNKEFMDFDKVKINGKLNLITDTSSLYALIGKPTDIETPNYDDVCVSYFSRPNFRYVKYGKSSFELYGDTIVYRFFNFKDNPNLFLNYYKLTLNSKTTIHEIAKFFPKAVKFKSETNVAEEGKLISVNFKVKNDKNFEDFWIFFFKNGFLYRIDYWMPC
jgi:hypothetical protein